MAESYNQQQQQQEQENEDNCYLKWSDHEDYMPLVALELFNENSMVDVTLAVDGEKIYAHRIVLSACSYFLQELLSEAKDDHPTIIISGVSATDVKDIVEYCYSGKISLSSRSLAEAASLFQLNGIMTIDVFDDDLSLNTKVTSDDSQEALTTFITSDNELLNESLDIRVDIDDDCHDEINDNQQHEEAKEELQGDEEEEEEQQQLQDEEKEEEEEEEEQEQEPQQQQQQQQDDDDFKNEIQINNIDNNDNKNKKKRRRKEHTKREYSDEMLESALRDLKNGQSLIEASTKNGIPRSTLYMRAKTMQIQLHAARNEYSPESMKGAISAVLKGSSLQNASEKFRIPKTVLWRRIQKEGYHIIRSEPKKSYGSERRLAAVKALERGENLTKVSLEFKIPKTTLFRDKARLVNEGKLPSSFWKKRKTANEAFKKSKLEEAVAACRNGILSQAAAAVRYGIPKTTIWRRLQLDNNNKKSEGQNTEKKKKIKPLRRPVVVLNKPVEDTEYSLCGTSSDIPITYIDESSLSEIPQNSVIILTTEDVDSLDLGVNRDGTIIVNTVHDQEFVSSIGLEDDPSNYTSTES